MVCSLPECGCVFIVLRADQLLCPVLLLPIQSTRIVFIHVNSNSISISIITIIDIRGVLYLHRIWQHHLYSVSTQLLPINPLSKIQDIRLLPYSSPHCHHLIIIPILAENPDYFSVHSIPHRHGAVHLHHLRSLQ